MWEQNLSNEKIEFYKKQEISPNYKKIISFIFDAKMCLIINLQNYMFYSDPLSIIIL